MQVTHLSATVIEASELSRQDPVRMGPIEVLIDPVGVHPGDNDQAFIAGGGDDVTVQIMITEGDGPVVQWEPRRGSSRRCRRR